MNPKMVKFCEHLHTCETCKKNVPGTRPFAMKLCMEGMVFRADAFGAVEKVVIVRLVSLVLLVLLAAILVGVRLGAEPAFALVLLFIATRIEVKG